MLLIEGRVEADNFRYLLAAVRNYVDNTLRVRQSMFWNELFCGTAAVAYWR